MDEEDGAEVLLLQEGCALGGLDDGRLDEVPASGESLPAVEHLPSLLLDAGEGVVVDLHCGCVVERAAEGAGFKRVSDLD